MKTKIVFMVLVVTAALIASSMQNSGASTTNFTAKQELPAFLNNVIGIDLSGYQLTTENYAAIYPSTYGGVVKEEDVNLNYNASDGSSLQVMAIFYNGYPYRIIADCIGSIKYINQPSDNRLDATRTILTNYQKFSQPYGIDTQNIALASNMLRSVNDLTTLNTTSGNMKMKILQTSETNAVTAIGSIVNRTQTDWIYTVSGIDVAWKCISLAFVQSSIGVEFSFKDTWGLFKVADLGIEEAQAQAIAWNAVNNYNLTAVADDNSTTILHPDWSGMRVDARISMTPGQTYNDSINSIYHYANMGSVTREPLTLYPEWQFVFYFGKPIGNMAGIQAAVWGDTKEIVYCNPYGYYGNLNTETPQPTVKQDSTLSGNTLLIIAAAIIGSIVLATGVYAKKRKK